MSGQLTATQVDHCSICISRRNRGADTGDLQRNATAYYPNQLSGRFELELSDRLML